MRRKSMLPIIIVVIFSLSIIAGCSEYTAIGNPLTQSQPSGGTNDVEPIKYTTANVKRVVDGDTFHVVLNGKDETVRLIGVDTPETVKPNTTVQPYGEEASKYTKSQLTGKTVYLEFDVEERDKYGRLLCYAWMSPPTDASDKEIRDKMFNARLLLEGYARLMTVPPNVKYAEYFIEHQTEARNKKSGLWGL